MGVEEVADLTDRELLRRGCRMVTGVHVRRKAPDVHDTLAYMYASWYRGSYHEDQPIPGHHSYKELTHHGTRRHPDHSGRQPHR